MDFRGNFPHFLQFRTIFSIFFLISGFQAVFHSAQARQNPKGRVAQTAILLSCAKCTTERSAGNTTGSRAVVFLLVKIVHSFYIHPD